MSDVAHIGHVELLTPRPEDSLRFFHQVLGMEVEATEGGAVFLRGWGLRHTQPGAGAGRSDYFRMRSPRSGSSLIRPYFLLRADSFSIVGSFRSSRHWGSLIALAASGGISV